MKQEIIKQLSKHTALSKQEVENLLETPPSQELGDFAFPCFSLAKKLKKNPNQIAQDLSEKLKSKDFEEIQTKGPYVNFFLNKAKLAQETTKEILKQKEKYGSSKKGNGEIVLIEFSSPNIAKPFGIGHLRSTIIGSAIANLAKFNGYKTIKTNYLGDWGTPFGKIIAGYKKFGSEEKLREDPIKHLLDIYVKATASKELEEQGREWFKKLENGDKEALELWKRFRELSLKEFNKIYSLLNVHFDVISGESVYNKKMSATIELLEKKNLLEKSDGAMIVNLEEQNLGVALIQKSDGATLYATRDLTAAIDRHKKYKFDKMFYEVGSEQKFYFQQLFKILDLLGFKWAKNCKHIDHGLYLDKDGKKFSTRKGKTIFMEDIITETKNLAKKEIAKREKLSEKELEERGMKVALAAIIYGDLKNYRANGVIFDIERFVKFEGNTGPYLLYTYARAQSIIEKSSRKKSEEKINSLSSSEKKLVMELSKFHEVVESAFNSQSPNLVANYAYNLSQIFNEFYHAEKVIGSENESFRLGLVKAFSQVLKNSLALLGIETLKKM